ncbi:MAG: hypothetical protein VYA69_16050 [Gemmatimonadota bacterium]|nr:hypothetical protein [Gemmatimonadota bacterium]
MLSPKTQYLRIGITLFWCTVLLLFIAFLSVESAYPVFLNRYSEKFLVILFINLLLIVFLLLEIIFPRVINHVSRIQQMPSWQRHIIVVICIITILSGTGVFLLSTFYSNLFIVLLACVICGLSTLLLCFNPTESRLSYHVLIWSLVFPLALFDQGLALFETADESQRDYYQGAQTLKDFSHIKDGFGEGGELAVNLNEYMVGEEEPVKIITNSKGFRNDTEFAYQPEEGTFRILYVGDSFVAGFRVGQEDMSGSVMERRLNDIINTRPSDWKRVEVMVSAAEEPGLEWYWLQEYGFRYNPHMIVLGICIGNDIAQSYLSLDPQGAFAIVKHQNSLSIKKTSVPEIGFSTPPFNEFFIPDRAKLFRMPGWQRHLRYLFTESPLVSRINRSTGNAEGIISWYGDSWHGDQASQNPIHGFDPIHGLGLYYYPSLDIVNVAFQRFHRIIVGMYKNAQDRNMVFLPVLFSQRFQVSEREWAATVRQFSLNPEAFDLTYPNRTIISRFERDRIPYLDLLSAFQEADHSKSESYFMPMGDMHWNSKGHEVAGQAIAEFISDRFLIEDH